MTDNIITSCVLRKQSKNINAVVPGFRVPGFSTLPGFRALKADNRAWSVHETLFGFRAPISPALNERFRSIFTAKSLFFWGLDFKVLS